MSDDKTTKNVEEETVVTDDSAQADGPVVEETPAAEATQTTEAPAGGPEERSQESTAVSPQASEDAPFEGLSPSGPKPEKPKGQDPQKAKKPVSASLEKIIESIEKLSVLELADLVKALEDKFGVSASAPVAMASAGAAPAAAGNPQEEKTTFNVILTSGGANKIGAIKAVRELVPTLGLKEAKDLVEAAPKPVLESVNKATAEEAKAKLTAAGATVELQ